MGDWAKNEFGKSFIGKVAIVVAGTGSKESEKKALSFFDNVISEKDIVFHAYLVKKGKKTYPIIFRVYGAPAMVDLLSILHDGGCRTVIFIGYAYGGFKDLEVGSVVVPNKSYHFDGIYHHIDPDRTFVYPDEKLLSLINKLLEKNKIKTITGINISVPAVSFQLPHANKEYKKINPLTLEMELASCLSRSKDIGIRSAGILVISDNKKSSIANTKKYDLRRNSKLKILKTIVQNIDKFDLPALKVKEKFSINKYLASVIEDENSKHNVYKK